MKYLVALGFLGMASAFQPNNRGDLKDAVNACVGNNNDFSSTDNGSECYACLDGTMKTSAESCAAGDTAQFISDWDTSQVNDMHDLFKQKYSFDQDIGNWDTSLVENMYDMFLKAYEYNNAGQPLNWDVSKVGNFVGAFNHARKFNQCLCNWTLMVGTCTRSMFKDAWEFDQDLSCWIWGKNTGTWGVNNGLAHSLDYCDQYVFASTSLSSHLCTATLIDSNSFTNNTAEQSTTCTSTGCIVGDACVNAATPAEYIDGQCCECA